MSIHEGFLDLAATAIDFDLDEYERAELDRHIAGCGDCRRDTAALRDDAVGPDNTMFLTHEATTDDAGGSIVAIGEDGGIVAGWPVGLKRRGSEIWSIVVAQTGTAYGIAVEPEPNGSHSATILTLAPDSTVRYTLTIVEP